MEQDQSNPLPVDDHKVESESTLFGSKADSFSKTPTTTKNSNQTPILFLLAFIALVTTAILILHYPSQPNETLWEYKTIKLYNTGLERTGTEAGKYASIVLDEEKLNELGKEGWELVSTSLEMETAFYNFGNDSYVTGIQPNVRPQCLNCIFKR